MGLFDLFSNDKAEEAAQQRKDGLQKGYDTLSTTYDQGRDALTSNYGYAGDLYKNLMTSYAPGAQAYGDATGANGADGYARARTNFQTDPGYQFQLDQGLQALQRTRSASGDLASGRADTDTLRFATGLADQSYGSYVNRFLPYLTGQGSATAGAAGVATGLGSGLNASYQGQGAAANANYTGQGAADAAATMNNYQVGANVFNALKGGAEFVAGGGISNLANGAKSGASSLFSMFA